jgi:hypothetical protein
LPEVRGSDGVFTKTFLRRGIHSWHFQVTTLSFPASTIYCHFERAYNFTGRIPMVEDSKAGSSAVKQSDSRYLRGFLIFLFFWYFVGPVIGGIIHLSAGIVGITDFHSGPGTWANSAGSLIGAAIGLFFAVRRIRTNTPWKMTAYRRALMFACFYFVFQELWIVFLFGIGELLSPAKALKTILVALNYVIRFPSAFFSQGYWTLFIDSLCWAAGFYLVLKIIEKKRRAGVL